MYEGGFEVTASYFQKTFLFPMNLNDFMKLFVQLDATWGAFWGDFGGTLVPLWGDFGHMAVEWQV